LVEHEIALPTASVQPDRNFDGQQFVFHQVANARWLPASIDGFEARDIGIGAATNGVASVMVLRTTGAAQSGFICHDAEFFFNFVLQGTAALCCGDDMRWQVSAGDSFVIPRDTRFEFVDNSSDLELLQVALPGDFTLNRG